MTRRRQDCPHATVAMLCLLAACKIDSTTFQQDALNDVATTDAGPDTRRVVAEVPVTPNRNLDLLFVIDDSPSMGDKQANLIANFGSFIDVLSALPGGLPNLHIGVVTTDMGTKGSEVAQPGPPVGVGPGSCTGFGKAGVLQSNDPLIDGRFLIDIATGAGGRLKNYTGNLAARFGTIANVGASSCALEQPLAAMQAALTNTVENAGFLRFDAVLGVVFLVDEDDCSIKDPVIFGPDDVTFGPLNSFRCTRFGVTCALGGPTPDQMYQVGAKTTCRSSTGSNYMTEVEPYYQYLVALKGDARKVAVASIMGDPTPVNVQLETVGASQRIALTPSCTYQGASGPEVAVPGVRMQSFLDQFPTSSTSATICQRDLAGSLGLIAQQISREAGQPCIAVALADTDPGEGTSYDCIVEDLVGATATVIPACSAGVAPTCWSLESTPATCPLVDHLQLVVTRSEAPDPATITRMRCQLP